MRGTRGRSATACVTRRSIASEKRLKVRLGEFCCFLGARVGLRARKKRHGCAAKASPLAACRLVASERGEQPATCSASSGKYYQEGGFGPTERNAAEISSHRVGPQAAAALRFIFRTRNGLRAREKSALAPRRPRLSPLAVCHVESNVLYISTPQPPGSIRRDRVRLRPNETPPQEATTASEQRRQ